MKVIIKSFVKVTLNFHLYTSAAVEGSVSSGGGGGTVVVFSGGGKGGGATSVGGGTAVSGVEPGPGTIFPIVVDIDSWY